jgi:hypothetical protein
MEQGDDRVRWQSYWPSTVAHPLDLVVVCLLQLWSAILLGIREVLP